MFRFAAFCSKNNVTAKSTRIYGINLLLHRLKGWDNVLKLYCTLGVIPKHSTTAIRIAQLFIVANFPHDEIETGSSNCRRGWGQDPSFRSWMSPHILGQLGACYYRHFNSRVVHDAPRIVLWLEQGGSRIRQLQILQGKIIKILPSRLPEQIMHFELFLEVAHYFKVFWMLMLVTKTESMTKFMHNVKLYVSRWFACKIQHHSGFSYKNVCILGFTSKFGVTSTNCYKAIVKWIMYLRSMTYVRTYAYVAHTALSNLNSQKF